MKKFPRLFCRSLMMGSWSRGAGKASDLTTDVGQYILLAGHCERQTAVGGISPRGGQVLTSRIDCWWSSGTKLMQGALCEYRSNR